MKKRNSTFGGVDFLGNSENNHSRQSELRESREFIPYALPNIGNEEKKEILDTLDSGWLSTGPKTRIFEEKVKEYFQDEELEIIAVSSCTAALHLQLLAGGIKAGDEVITSPMTFCSTVNSILYTGARPVLVDINPKTYNLDIDLIEERITSRTKAIVPVYYGGQALDSEKLSFLAKKYGLLILADAAHAMGAKYKEKYCGTYEDSAAFSFYATKNMTTGEGGLITTHNKDFATKMRRLLMHGMDKDAWKRYSEKGTWYYDISDLGYKYNFTDIQAALGIHQLQKIDEFNKVRRKFAKIYDDAFSSIQGLRVHEIDPNGYHTRHLYPIHIDESSTGISRNHFIERLNKSKIGVSVHYIPINHHSYYREYLSSHSMDLPNTEETFKGLVSLPCNPKMDIKDVMYVRDTVLHILESSG